MTSGSQWVILMPKNTFLNLPDEKQKLIISVAVDEFARYPFSHASINRIVTNSGIAKGSFYQYFEDKQDLFLTILQIVAREKVAYLTPLLENADQLDFFQLLRQLHTASLKFAADYPQYTAISTHLLKEKDSKIYRSAISSNFSSGIDFYRTLLNRALERGQVRADIDVHMLAYLITLINNGMVEYYVEFVSDQYDDTMLATIDQFINFIEFGLSASKSGNQNRHVSESTKGEKV